MSGSYANNKDSFRDSIATISKEGKRAWVYPKKPSGPYYKKRTILNAVFLSLMFLGPFMKWNGHPLMLFNVLERKFILFGIPFWPQDFFLFVLAMLTFFVFIILFTSIFGRVWCGWACPQTIFMEGVFRKLEYWIEGDAKEQRKLSTAAWSADKIRKKLIKHSLFLIISFFIANVFLAYIIGVDELSLLASDGPFKHIGGFISLLVFTGVFYGVYARFREQACIVVCPYGRLQGVLLDRNSVVIAYDYRRGEPRGKINKKTERKEGDCIDCNLCVDVCPTGIDIRNGTQLECVNCTACIDACNTVMEKVNFPKGLIRYTSEESIATKSKFKITPRIIGYSVVLTLLFSTLVLLLIFRSDVSTTVLRTPGQLYQVQDNGMVSNLYNVHMVNKTFHDLPVSLRLVNEKGEIKYVGATLEEVKSDSTAEAVFFVLLPMDEIRQLKTKLEIEVISGDKVIDKIETNFLGPN